jgi:endo-1,4-beta-xylanase
MSYSPYEFQLKHNHSVNMLKKMLILIVIIILTCLVYFYFSNKKPLAIGNPSTSASLRLSETTHLGASEIARKSDKTNKQVAVHVNANNSPPNNTRNLVSALKLKSIDTGLNDPTIVKRLLLKKGIYFGDYLGNADVNLEAPRPKNFLTILNKYFNLYSIPAWFHHTENAGRGVFDFSGPDQVADFAVASGAKIHAHNLVWYLMMPAWLTKGTFTPDQLKDILKNHVQTVVTHYKNKYHGSIIAWDVVNEPLCDTYSNSSGCDITGLRKSIWPVIHKPGSTDPSDYIQLAFEWAHEADPNVKLYINEGGTEFKGPKWNNLYALVKKLKSKGVPINGVGFQAHFDVYYNHPLTELLSNMNMLAAIGLQSQITEMDVSLSKVTETPWIWKPIASPGLADYDKQAAIYAATLNACIHAKNCNAFIVFGAWDPATWANQTWKDKNKTGKFVGPFYPDILDDNMRPKKALKAMIKEANN